MRIIEIQADQVIPCMGGARIFERGAVEETRVCEVRCGWAQICRVLLHPDGTHEVTAVACAHPRHGVRPEFEGMHEKLEPYLPAIDDCPLCEGGWLLPTSEQARQQIMLGHAIGVYRGIRIPRMDRPDKESEEGKP